MAELSDGTDARIVTGKCGRFSLVPLVRRWVRMTHPDCGAQVDFVDPTKPKVTWYADHHDCDARDWWTAQW